jgi:peptide/nickel transport system permease protein
VSDVVAATSSAEHAVPHASRRFSPSVVVAFVIVTIVVVCAVLGPWIAPHDPAEQNLLAGLQSPGGKYPLGSDDLGRDVLSRTIVGARTAFFGPLAIALGAAFIGNVLGLIAGYRGGLTDSVISRSVDVVYALPALLVAIVVLGIFGGGYLRAVGLLIVLFVPVEARIVRGATLDQRSRAYVEAARVLGLSSRRIMFRHIWPNILPLALASAFLTFAFSLVALCSLSFLGLGVAPGASDWGSMLSENRDFLLQNPVAALAPGVALVAMAASVNVIGDWLFERTSDRGRTR